MTKAEEKAIELMDKYIELTPYKQDFELAKKMALICVDEIIKEIPMYKGELNPRYEFWQQVKKAINEIN